MAHQRYNTDFDMLDKKSKKVIKEELKIQLKENMKKNKHIKDFDVFLKDAGIINEKSRTCNLCGSILGDLERYHSDKVGKDKTLCQSCHDKL